METNRLRQFCTVVETGNLRQAAELLGISHGGLSKSLKVFEQEVGFTLFKSSGRGLSVTDRGRGLYLKSFSFFKELEDLLANDQRLQRQVIRLGSFEVFTSYLMGQMCTEELSDHYVEIHELTPGHIEEALMDEKIDIGLTYQPIPRKGIEYLKVVRIRMAAYTVRKAFAGKALLDIPFVVPITPIEGVPSEAKGLDGWPEDQFERKVQYRVALMETAINLARQGCCAIFLPPFVVRIHNESVRAEFQLVEREIPPKIKSVWRDVYVVKRESTEEGTVMKKVAKALRKYCKN